MQVAASSAADGLLLLSSCLQRSAALACLGSSSSSAKENPGLDFALITRPSTSPVFCLRLSFHGIFKGAVSLHLGWLPCRPWLVGREWNGYPPQAEILACDTCVVRPLESSRRVSAAAILWPGRVRTEGTGPAGQAHCAPADHTKSRSVENLGPRCLEAPKTWRG